MNNFSFAITGLKDGHMTCVVVLGEDKIIMKPSYLCGDDLTQLIFAVLGFHPEYDNLRSGMAWDREDAVIPCDHIEIDEEGSKVIWDISVNKTLSNIDDRILHIRIFLDWNVTQRTIEADVSYRNFAEEIMREIDRLIRSIGLKNYYCEWGKPFPITDFLNAKMLLTGQEANDLFDELTVLKIPFYIPLIEGAIQQFTIVSQKFFFGCQPDKDTITRQRLTFTNDGKVCLSLYNEAGGEAETAVLFADREKTEEIIQDLVNCFQGGDDAFDAVDFGIWQLTMENERGKKYRFKGWLGPDEGERLSGLSKKIRKCLKRKDLFVFDGDTEEKYIYCSCEFKWGDKSYYYRTEDDTLEVGDLVRVPVGTNGGTAVVEIVDIECFEKYELPMPLDQVKSIIGKVDKSEEDEQDE